MRSLPAFIRSSLLGAACLLSACTVCDRETDADGRYPVLTDCSGSGLARGEIEIGPYSLDENETLRGTNCSQQSDGGAHGYEPPGADGGSSGETCYRYTEPQYDENGCPETAAAGAALLGLPNRVRVIGEKDFELFGEVRGRSLECKPERFGNEKLLFCRSAGRVICVAVVEAW